MAGTAVEHLYDIIRDPASGLRNRLNAAVAASRVEPLAMPGEAAPEAVMFLREIVGTEHEGSRFRVEYRREAASALAYWERRAAKMALTYEVPDQAERAAGWRRVLNGTLRANPDKAALLGPSDTFELPPGDPERVLAALLLPVSGTQARRRQRAVDDPGGVQPIATEAERRELIKPLADIIEARIANTDPRRTQLG